MRYRPVSFLVSTASTIIAGRFPGGLQGSLAGLTPEVRAKIFGENARKLYRR
jgi:predicted TIM-barrel fold metal-dependent hydrolase